LPVVYKGLRMDCGCRVALIVADAVVVELKTIDRLALVHDAQLLTYLRLGGWKVGLLINFNVGLLRNGIHRRVLGLEE
jgi:GxxExxY protein